MIAALPAYAPVTLADGSRWWLAEAAWREQAEAAARWIAEPERLPADALLKTATRRLVFTIDGIEAGTGAVVKAFPLEGFRTRLKQQKYAPSEAANLAEAARRGVPVPALYGWGERRRAGLVRWNAVLMERIGGATFADLALARGAVSGAPEAGGSGAATDWLNRSARLLAAVYSAGCNHIDLKPETLYFGESAARDRIIDFQYCTFGSPSLTTFMAQLGYFAYWWDRSFGPD